MTPVRKENEKDSKSSESCSPLSSNGLKPVVSKTTGPALVCTTGGSSAPPHLLKPSRARTRPLLPVRGTTMKDGPTSTSSKTVVGRALGSTLHPDAASLRPGSKDGVGTALTDTPASTAPSSPQIPAQSTNKVRATTLDIPGLTRSKVSPDGRIPQRDLGSKLVIVMVGLPARGKSYITKKMARYLNWLQHDTRIFNVGERRRLAAGMPFPSMLHLREQNRNFADLIRNINASDLNQPSSLEASEALPPPVVPPAQIFVNSKVAQIPETPSESSIRSSPPNEEATPPYQPDNDLSRSSEVIDQSATFFDPSNQRAVQFREAVALATLDELLDYILEQGGSVGILDATNSTVERRKAVMQHIRRRAGPELGVLFLESRCIDPAVLESNMRLKLSGPDYKDQDPIKALKDFRKRVALYEQSYVPLGEFEDRNNIAYVQMIDVGRKVVAHQTNGFLSSQVVYYLLNFNLSPRQIWITRHGESIDNQLGRIGGNSELSENGHRYAKALTRFIDEQRRKWEDYQEQKARTTHFPPLPGDSTPPNPAYGPRDRPRHFCVWSSMMVRAIQSVQYFNEDDYDLKQMRMLDELYAGKMEGMTYEEIKERFPDEYNHRKKEKLHYRYPDGGEGYLDVINRLRAVIIEVERMTDHLLLVTHRSVARVLLAYFLGLNRDEVAGLDVPLGVLYMLDPKPYGVEFKAYRYNPDQDWFDYIPDFRLLQTTAYQ